MQEAFSVGMHSTQVRSASFDSRRKTHITMLDREWRSISRVLGKIVSEPVLVLVIVATERGLLLLRVAQLPIIFCPVQQPRLRLLLCLFRLLFSTQLAVFVVLRIARHGERRGVLL